MADAGALAQYSLAYVLEQMSSGAVTRPILEYQTASLARGAATVPTPRGPVMVTFTRAGGKGQA